jgi:RNA polymerase sigma-70 factor (ECF subfamily)
MSLLRPTSDAIAADLQGRERNSARTDDAERGARGRDRVLADALRAEQPWLIGYFRRNVRVPEDAHDLAQETLLRFLRAASRTAIDTPQAYLRTIAANVARNWAARSSSRIERHSVPLDDAARIAGDITDDLAARSDLAACAALLGALDPETREIFLLNRLDGMTFKAIAKRLGLRKWTVRRRIRAVLDQLEAAVDCD